MALNRISAMVPCENGITLSDVQASHEESTQSVICLHEGWKIPSNGFLSVSTTLYVRKVVSDDTWQNMV